MFFVSTSAEQPKNLIICKRSIIPDRFLLTLPTLAEANVFCSHFPSEEVVSP